MTVTIECVVRRGGLAESRHRVEAVALDGTCTKILETRAAGELVSMRSAAKPFQAHAALAAGAFDAAGFGEPELALACASHGGEALHVDGVRGMLGKLGLGVEALRCGVHPPIHAPAARAIWSAGGEPTALHNNCSGKHAGMLALARHLDADLEHYLEPTHRVQHSIIASISALARMEPAVAVDNCGVPCLFLPLERAAGLYASLACGITPALERIFEAMATHPFLVAGTDRFDTALMEAFEGRAVSKTGAEGVLGMALRPEDGPPVGLFLECADGAERALAPAAVAVLEYIGLLDAVTGPRLAKWACGERFNHAGRHVGDVEVRIESSRA